MKMQWLSARFVQLSMISLSLLFEGCGNDRELPIRTAATRSLVQTYSSALKAVTKDCGIEAVETRALPEAFFNNPGWKKWNGPYLQGAMGRGGSDYFGTKLRFMVTADSAMVRSAGADLKFDTPDDIIGEEPIQ